MQMQQLFMILYAQKLEKVAIHGQNEEDSASTVGEKQLLFSFGCFDLSFEKSKRLKTEKGIYQFQGNGDPCVMIHETSYISPDIYTPPTNA